MSTNRLVEFHSHSSHSDGEYTPSQLAHVIAERGIGVWALTDHDTCSGVEEARDASHSMGLTCVAGIEISAWQERSIHVLGLGVDPKTMSSFADLRGKMRILRMQNMVERLHDLGVTITLNDVLETAAGGSVGRPHLARVLVKNDVVGSVSEAFEKYLGTDCPAYVETTWPPVVEAIQLIHEAGGIAVIAHPGKDSVTRSEVELWRKQGLDGLEVLHPRHDRKHAMFYEDLADSLDMFKLGSTDYHGAGPNGLMPGVEMPRRWLEPVLNRLGLT